MKKRGKNERDDFFPGKFVTLKSKSNYIEPLYSSSLSWLSIKSLFLKKNFAVTLYGSFK